ATDTTVVVVSPGWGDHVQLAKAGILEIADIFVVNKADREGADAAERDLHQMIRMNPPAAWTPPVVKTAAATGEGTDELWDAIEGHRAHLEGDGGLDAGRRARLAREVESLASERLRGRMRRLLEEDEALSRELAERRVDPYRAAAILMNKVHTGS
ncbi:MAG: methylmalonyl Co-A mutase-associated GTPase MeaB, partial [Actinomycetota bacterium]